MTSVHVYLYLPVPGTGTGTYDRQTQEKRRAMKFKDPTSITISRVPLSLRLLSMTASTMIVRACCLLLTFHWLLPIFAFVLVPSPPTTNDEEQPQHESSSPEASTTRTRSQQNNSNSNSNDNIPRVFRSRGSAYDIGVHYGEAYSSQIRELLEWKKQEHASIFLEWQAMATSAEAVIQEYSPLYYQELRGMVDGGGTAGLLSMEDLLLLATEYEAEMLKYSRRGEDHDGGNAGGPTTRSNNHLSSLTSSSSSSSKGCTGFSLPGKLIASSSSWIGQTNDEDPKSWKNGTWDVILQWELEELNHQPIWMYTHFGIPAYLGMNLAARRGLTWFYIDALGCRDLFQGLPTSVLIRELLYRTAISQSMEEIAEWTERVPKTVPYAFVMLDHNTSTSWTMELAPNTTMAVLSTYWPQVHANHVLYNTKLWLGEVRRQDFDVGHRSVDRYRVMQDKLQEVVAANHHPSNKETGAGTTGGINETQLFSMLATPPIQNAHTLATVVMDLGKRCFSILWYDQMGTTPLDYDRLCHDGNKNDKSQRDATNSEEATIKAIS